MGLLDLMKKKTWQEKDAWDGKESQDCPRCGQAMTKAYYYSDWWCDNCHAGLDDDEDEEDENEEYDDYGDEPDNDYCRQCGADDWPHCKTYCGKMGDD